MYFASNPGQAIAHQVGKLQIEQFLADASLSDVDAFSFRRFHDYLTSNGNVPIAVQRWEYLDRDEEILRLETLRHKPVTVPN